MPRRRVTTSEAAAWAKKRGFKYFETSAANGEGVSEMFMALFGESITALKKAT
jgi:Ras family protein